MGSEELETIVSADGLRRAGFYRLPSGYFSFTEEIWVEEDLTEFGGGVERYWSPSHISGLYAAEAEARADAYGTLPWLRAAPRDAPD